MPRGHAEFYRLSAAPGSLAVLLWALLHLLNLGEARQVVVFSGMVLIAGAALVRNLGLARRAYREVGLFGARRSARASSGASLAGGGRPSRCWSISRYSACTP